MDLISLLRRYFPKVRRYLPIVGTAAILATVLMYAVLAAGPRTYTGAELGVTGPAPGGEPRATPAARATTDPTPSEVPTPAATQAPPETDRKSTRLNSSHRCISYAVFCLKKKKKAQKYNKTDI